MLGEGNNETKEQLKNDSILNIVAHSIVNKFDTLYEHIDELKKKASNEHELNQITHMEDRVDSLAQKTLSQSQDLTKTTQRNNVQQELQKLRKQIQILQKQQEKMSQRQDDLERRVDEIECKMVSRQQFQQLKSTCEERFSMFDNRFKVIKKQNEQLCMYVDEQFKKRIQPSEQFKNKLNQLMNTNFRLFSYAKKMYWSLINQILAYRVLSTGMVQKGTITDKSRESALFKQIVNVVNTATYIIAGIPFASSLVLVVKDISSIFFDKKEDVMQHNMKLRVEGYFTEDQISQDVARAVLQLVSNPLVDNRLQEFQTKNMIMGALTKFFQFIATFTLSPTLLADIFAEKLTKIKKQKADNDYILENVLTDTSLIMWKVAQVSPNEKRWPMTSAVRALFNKNMYDPNYQQFYSFTQVQNKGNPNFNMSFSQQPPSIGIQNANFVGGPMAVEFSNSMQNNRYMNTNMHNAYLPNNPQMNKAYQSGISTNASKVEQSGQSKPYQNICQSQNSINGQSANMGIYQNSSGFSNYPSYYNIQRPPYFKLAIIKAQLTMKKPMFKLNPYCVAKYQAKLVRTQIHKGGDLTPQWNQQFIMETANNSSAITIQLYDKERLLSDTLLGTANLMDSQIGAKQQCVELWNKGKVVGKLIVGLKP